MIGSAVQRYSRPASLDEALDARRADPGARWLAGGTVLLAGDAADKPASVIDVAACVPRGIAREPRGLPGDEELVLGAGAVFQEIAESKAVPPYLAEAFRTMANRNTRNRATLGGNLGADKSCSSLIPILIVLEAEVETVSPSAPKPRRTPVEEWLKARAESALSERASDLVLRVALPLPDSRRAAYRRWNRVSCDLSVLGAAASFALEAGSPRGLRIAVGGLGPKARRAPRLEALFEGRPLPSREAIEAAVAPLLQPLGDLRASAAFKRLRGSQLVADAILGAATADALREASL